MSPSIPDKWTATIIEHSSFKNKKVLGASLLFIVSLSIALPLSIYSVLKPIEPRPKYDYATKGSVVSNTGPCSDVGIQFLKLTDNAIDAMIATMVCDGVVGMSDMGVGGGFMATIYKHDEKKAYTMNARETAPASATQDMFVGKMGRATTGGLAVAVPGAILGYWEMHKKFGKAAWKDLFAPSIKMCKEGITIVKHVANAIHNRVPTAIQNSKTLSDLLRTKSGARPEENDIIFMPKLADTLTLIAEKGPSVLYNGSLSASLIEDIKAQGGIMTVEDLAGYKALWEEPTIVNLAGNIKLYSGNAPSSGPLFAFIMDILNQMLPTTSEENDIVMITEALKFAYAARTRIGDPHVVNISNILNLLKNSSYVDEIKTMLLPDQTSDSLEYYGADSSIKDDHGTANMVVLSPNGDAVVTTATINHIFGSKYVSQSTGIILNNQMDDFSTPGAVNAFGLKPSPSNFIRPNGRPVTSMCPSIFVNDNGDVRLAIGAAGGSKITSAVALVAIRNLWLNEPIAESIEAPRYHHQVLPMLWYYERTLPPEPVLNMLSKGHSVKQTARAGSVVTAISKIDDQIVGAIDSRRAGNISYIEPPTRLFF